jgi:hypothetical protein
MNIRYRMTGINFLLPVSFLLLNICTGAHSLFGQYLQFGQKITVDDTLFSSRGYSIAISYDGNTMTMGGPADNNYQGAAWVFQYSGNKWIQAGKKLYVQDSTTSSLGSSIAISSDGNTIVVGGPNNNSNEGAAWVFTRSGSQWVQQGGKLQGTGGTALAYQGNSVDISSDGNTLIIGGNANNSYTGAAWIFVRSGNTWTQQAALNISKPFDGSEFGISVALSANGNTALIGEPRDSSSYGAAWIYTRTADKWTVRKKLVPVDGILYPAFGSSVKLSSGGNVAIVAGQYDNGTKGAVWIFEGSGTQCAQINIIL